MGPVVRVPQEVADTLEQGSLVEQVISTPDAVDAVDVTLGPDGQLLMLVEAAHQGYSELVAAIVFSDYVRTYSDGAPFVLIVRDADEVAHPFPAGPVTEASVRAQLALAWYGDPGERRPLVDGDH